SWRCVTCIRSPTYCTSCLRTSHEFLPLHRVQFWDASHFRNAWLRQVGVRIHCGHDGLPCPHPPDGEAPLHGPRAADSLDGSDRMVCVVDVNGVHELPIVFCRCPDAIRDDLQLLRLGLYPASIRRPRTAFTTRVLDDFLLANRECHTSARNYFNKLRRTTNAAFPHLVPDRYKELLRLSRQWRNLQMRKRAGFGHRADAIGPGDLAIRCPACPDPDLNLPENWKEDQQQWKYMRSVVLDGNFSAQHRRMKNPEDDVAFADGHTFMVEDAPYKAHLKSAKEFKENNTCNDHRAVLTSKMERGNLEATGIGAAACSRHGFFSPHTCVDFDKGEGYRHMDYATNWVLAFLNGLTTILLLYDIMCQYFVHLRARFEQSPHLHLPPGLTILRGIGQFHVHGHLPRCFARYSANFIRYAGIQDGEILETLWARLNEIAGSTRGMSSAHRREVIDDHMNDSNWMKLTRIVHALCRKWRRLCKEKAPAIEAYDRLSRAAGPELVARWTADAEAADAARDHTVEAMDIYDIHSKPLPSRKDVQAILIEQEMQGEPENANSAAEWISEGLRVEQRNVAFAARTLSLSTDGKNRLSLAQQRQKLTAAIASFHRAAKAHLPSGLLGGTVNLAVDPTDLGAEWDGIGESEPAPDSSTTEDDALAPEHQALALPSTLGLLFLQSHDRFHLAVKERELRQGQMNDALQGIRTAIGYKSLLYRTKIRKAPSYRAKLRSFDEVHVADESVRKHVRVYMQARKALERLYDVTRAEEVQERDAVLAKYRPIAKSDLRVETAIIEAFTRGLRDKESAWFWHVEDTDAAKGSGWMTGLRRMLWLRAYARKLRWEEEEIILQFEMECTERFFRGYAARWGTWGGSASSVGHGCYAAKQCSMWLGLAEHASRSFATVLALVKP
ncbi:hypothetical protein C8Q76DRAFT_622017, partial [Earliella scabrosa]